MNNPPGWLPPLEICEGDWLEYIDFIYSIFEADFLKYHPYLNQRIVRPIIQPITRGKVDAFWHIVEGGSGQGPEPDRCQRIRWPKPIIEEITRQNLKWWRIIEKGKKKFKIALNDFSYLVVLFERSNFYLLRTAFPISSENYRNQIERQYERERE